jgi:hypothetical protein
VLPEVVPDHDDRFCAAPFIGLQQRASHRRRNARQRKGRRGHVGDGLRLTGAGADGDAAFFHLDGAQIADRAETVAPQLVITARCGDRRVVGNIPVPQCDDRVAVRKRNRRPECLSRDLEPDGADGDRERYGDRRDRGERRMLDQHASAEPEVEHGEAQTAECVPAICFKGQHDDPPPLIEFERNWTARPQRRAQRITRVDTITFHRGGESAD